MATKKKARAKKAPPKRAAAKKRPVKKKGKKRAKRAVAVTGAVLEAAGIELEVPEPAARTREFLRYTAGLYYTTSLNGSTVKQMSEHVLFKSVPESTLEKWASADSWSQRRRHLMDRWRTQIEARIGSRLIQQKLKLVDELEEIQTTLLAKLKPSDHEFVAGGFITHGLIPVPVCKTCGNTAEQHVNPFAGVTGDKVVDVLLKLVKVREEMSEAILQVTATPGYGMANANGGQQAVTGLDTPKLTQDEARMAALAILRKRHDDALT